MKNEKFIFILLPLLFITGCTIFKPVKSPNVHTYTLNTINKPGPYERNSHLTLLVNKTRANPGFQTKNMIYVLQPHQLQQFSENCWTAAPADMITPLIVTSLENSHRFQAVVTPPYSGKTNLILDTQLIKLQQSFRTNPSQIELSLRAQLYSQRQNRVIGTATFNIAETAPANNPESGVRAANIAVAKLLKRLNAFVVKTSK